MTLEEEIGYTFQDKKLLEVALTHSSHANERRGDVENNERLEFLGDSILNMVAAEELYRTCRRLPEGELTKRRATLVCEQALFGYANLLGLGAHLRLGRGEDKSGGRARPSVLSDAFEALIAAIYLDGGFAAASAFVLPFLRAGAAAGADFKTQLQEFVQQDAGAQLQYVLAGETGPDHDKIFEVDVFLNGRPVGSGSGRSKKAAEQAAAQAALAHLMQSE